MHEVAVIELTELLIAGVPESRGHSAGSVTGLKLYVIVAVAVRAELFIGCEVNIVHGVAIAELIDKSAGHGEITFIEEGEIQTQGC